MRTFIAALLLGTGIVAAAHADERVLAFHSEIAVAQDGSMLVDETIRVRAEGEKIRHGIYRDFPTDYRDRYGNRVRVDFLPLTLTRDGADEPFHSEALGNGVRVYFGGEHSLVAPGEHTYVLGYKTARQLGFFADHDELYWNVTGNGWDFPIDAAGAVVALPPVDAGTLQLEGYTGVSGARGKAFRATVDEVARAVFETTRPLGPHEGLTIVVEFPKGIIAAPSSTQRAGWLLRDNATVLIGLVGLLLAWAYYLWQWLRVGRDPKPGVIIPHYEAPAGFSPGSLRYIERMKYDDRCFAADVVDLAVRGAVTIRQEGSAWSLHRARRERGTLPGPQTALLDSALGGESELVFQQSEHVRVAAALSQHKAAVTRQNSGRYFNTNSVLVIPGALLCVVALLISVAGGGSAGAAVGTGFMLFWLGGWTAGVVALLASVRRAWQQPAGIATSAAALFMTVFAVPFVAGEVFGLGAFFMIAGAGFGLVVVALVITNVAFFEWLKAPTVEGRKLLDQIAGLRLYIGVAERDDIARQRNAPPMTTEEFEKFLPYALALGVEKTWADRFAAVVGPAAVAAAAGAMAWYQGSSGLSDLSSFSGGLGSSLSGAISSSSSAPGSSSGGGGGGSSGGGGGGGGGGGW